MLPPTHLRAYYLCRFVGFSAVEPPPGRAPAPGGDARPSLHLFDSSEEYVAQCRAVVAQFDAPEERTHQGGHTVPNDAAAVARFGKPRDARTVPRCHLLCLSICAAVPFPVYCMWMLAQTFTAPFDVS